MVSADAYIGNKTKNPLKFQHYDISRAGFYIDDESIAKPPYKLDPANGQLIKPFMELNSILGKVGEDKDIGIHLRCQEIDMINRKDNFMWIKHYVERLFSIPCFTQ